MLYVVGSFPAFRQNLNWVKPGENIVNSSRHFNLDVWMIVRHHRGFFHLPPEITRASHHRSFLLLGGKNHEKLIQKFLGKEVLENNGLNA